MKQNLPLTIFSLLTLVLVLLHLPYDAIHQSDGMSPRELTISLIILLTILYGTVELAGRRAGYIIMLLGGLGGAALPYLHGTGPNTTRWGYFFVWTLFASGVTGSFTVILAATALWRSVRPRKSP